MYDPEPEIGMLRKRIIQLEDILAETRIRESEVIDLTMKGEAMRSQMMLNAILDGVIPKC